MSTPDTPEAARKKINSISLLPNLSILPLTLDIVVLALELCDKYNVVRQNYFDMQLAAFMIRYSIPVMLTENTKDFAIIDDFAAVSPFV